uniref:Tetraspanin n=1 Tax=Plectus sambesii TaxID=2011161 RepID=A0A914X9I8_9BILA
MEEISSTVTKPLILVSIAVLILTTMIPILTFISDINETDSVIQNFTKNSGDEGHLTTAIDAQATFYLFVLARAVIIICLAIVPMVCTFLLLRCLKNYYRQHTIDSWKANIIYLCLVAFVFLLLVVWGVAEVVVRNGTIGVKSAIAITTAAGRYKQANQTAAIDQLQQDLRCCGFILRDSRKLYVACADESAPNCSTAYDTAYWPIQLTIVLSIVDAIFAIGLVGVVCLQLRMRRRHSMLGNNNEEAALNPPAPSINPP